MAAEHSYLLKRSVNTASATLRECSLGYESLQRLKVVAGPTTIP